MKETMRNQLRIKAFGKIQDPLALAASRLLMLPVSMGNFGPRHCPVELIDRILTASRFTTKKWKEGKQLLQ